MELEIGGGGRRRQSSLAAINVTPLVDVMLVLLIIFMVTAPMLEQGVDVDLPEVNQAKNLPQTKEPVILTISKKGEVFVGDVQIKQPSKLVPVLTQILKKRSKEDVFLQADTNVPYGTVVQVMAEMQRAGIDRIGMVTRPETD